MIIISHHLPSKTKDEEKLYFLTGNRNKHRRFSTQRRYSADIDETQNDELKSPKPKTMQIQHPKSPNYQNPENPKRRMLNVPSFKNDKFFSVRASRWIFYTSCVIDFVRFFFLQIGIYRTGLIFIKFLICK